MVIVIASRGLRTCRVPQNVNFLYLQVNSTVDSCYVIETTTFGKHLKSIPNASTAPGSTCGSNTHNHSAIIHTHPNNFSHSHNLNSNKVGGGACNLGGCGPVSFARSGNAQHDHTRTGNATCPGDTVTNDGSHTHDSQNNEPPHLT